MKWRGKKGKKRFFFLTGWKNHNQSSPNPTGLNMHKWTGLYIRKQHTDHEGSYRRKQWTVTSKKIQHLMHEWRGGPEWQPASRRRHRNHEKKSVQLHSCQSGRTALGNRKEGMEEQMMCITNIEDKGFSKQTCLLLYEWRNPRGSFTSLHNTCKNKIKIHPVVKNLP